MMRKCHLNTCPVGIATQDPVLRAKFTGKPEHVINYFCFIAEQLRHIMAQLGFRKLIDMVGRVDMLETREAVEHWKARGLDFESVLYNPPVPSRIGRHCTTKQDHGLAEALDHLLIRHAQPALENRTPVMVDNLPIRNVHRTVGAMLSGRIARKYGSAGLLDNTIHFQFRLLRRAELRARSSLHGASRSNLEGDERTTTSAKASPADISFRLSGRNRNVRPRRKHPHRQRGALRRHQRRSFLQRHGGRALRRAQLRRDSGRGGPLAITAAST